MTKQILVAASLLVAACAAQADVLPASTTSTNTSYLDHWTDSKGNDIASSNVLGNGVRLVGGVTLGNESAAQALLRKASADAAAGAPVTIKRVDGISGTYAVAKSNYKAAAAAGDGVSVVSNSNGDLVITKGRTGGGGVVGGGDAGGGWAGGGAGGGASAGGSGSAPAAGNGVPSGNVTLPAQVPVDLGALPANGAGTGTGTIGAGAGAGATGDAALPSGEVPEPSTIALLAVGMAGALSLRRRAR